MGENCELTPTWGDVPVALAERAFLPGTSTAEVARP
jgi:hypothetical protein